MVDLARASALHPYHGDWMPVHFGHERVQGRGHTTTTYPPDTSGTRTYRFNSLGFRGEEFNPHATKTVFACGASVTLGVGVSEEEVWTRHFTACYAALHDCAVSDVNVLNFSQGASSNDYTTRTLLAQCARLKPDLLVAHFGGDNRRTEWFDRHVHMSIGPWLADSKTTRPVSNVIKGFYAYYTPQLGALNALKNMLLLQQYCRNHGIRAIFPWTDCMSTLDIAAAHPVCSALADLLDRDAVYQPRDAVDWSMDAGHPGPRSHRVFATQILDMCQLDRLSLRSVLCRSRDLHLDPGRNSGALPTNRSFTISDDMLAVVSALDGVRSVETLVMDCFGVPHLHSSTTDELLQSLRRLLHLGAIHFQASLSS